jgi:hypothetical protein
MAYKPEPPPDKANFAGTQGFAGVPSTSTNIGYSGYVGYKPVVNQIGDEPIIAVLIDSTVLGSHIWFSFARTLNL